jgi:hypothetical protein
MRFYGGGPVEAGNAGVFNNATIGANNNPLLDPRFKIQGGEPWNKTPILPGKDTQQYEQQQFNIPLQPQLPAAGVGNVGGVLFAQAQPKQTLKELIGNRPGGMSDIPGDVRFRQDTQFLPYDPGNYTQNSKQNPLRNNRWPAGMPQIWMQPGIAPYFGNRQGPGLYGEMGTGAI